MIRRFVRFAPAAVALTLSGCWNSPAEFMREPTLSPVGSGLAAGRDGLANGAQALAGPSTLVAPGSPAANLYTEQRVARVGDIVTVVISINDKATFGNTTDRSQTTKDGFALDFGLGSGSSSGSSTTLKTDLSSTATSQGQGNIDRSEQIQVSVAAVVTQVLPNGNLVISGSQEVRVNFELRQLTVGGIVHPADISRSNTIAYDRIAEARVSYGGRGRLSEMQQPSWGQQIYDTVKPF